MVEVKKTPMTMIQALRSAMDVMLARDDNVVIYGEDIGYFGGVFRCTEGLQAKYGRSRVFDTPIAEGGIVGIAVGMAAYGLRPVAEIQFADYMYPGYDQIVSAAARLAAGVRYAHHELGLSLRRCVSSRPSASGSSSASTRARSASVSGPNSAQTSGSAATFAGPSWATSCGESRRIFSGRTCSASRAPSPETRRSSQV